MKKIRNIKITTEQLNWALSEEDKKLTINVPTKNASTAPSDLSKAVNNARENGLDQSKTEFNVDLKESITFSKKDIMEKRRNILKENSITFTKKDFLKRK